MPLESYGVSSGGVSAVAQALTGFPIRLSRENGLWKLDYDALLSLTLADTDERS